MAWVREKNPKRKTSVPQRDPKEALEGLLSYLACKPAPGINIQRYLRETSAHKHSEPEVVQREPTVYDEEELQDEEDYHEERPRFEDRYEVASIRSHRTRTHQHHNHHPRDISPPPSPPPSRTPAARHVSNVEPRPYRPRTSVQTRRVVSSWSNATTPLVI